MDLLECPTSVLHNKIFFIKEISKYCLENLLSARCSPSVFSKVLAARHLFSKVLATRKTNLITARARKKNVLLASSQMLAKTIRYPYIFPEKSELPKFILPLKIILILSCGLRGGNKKFAEIRAGSFSRLVASPLDFELAAIPHSLVLQREPARRLAVLQNENCTKIDLSRHNYTLALLVEE